MALPKIAPYALPRETELPENRGGWRPEAGRCALLVHDMQLYFTSVFTPDADPLRGATANIRALIDLADERGMPVFYTAQNGDQDRRDRGLQADIWGPGMSSSPENQAIVPELLPKPGHHVLVKHRYSAFQRSNLEHLMRARDRDQLVVTGIYAHIGCMLTAADAFMRDIETFFIADAVADFSREKHDLATDYVAGRCGTVMTTAQFAEAVR